MPQLPVLFPNLSVWGNLGVHRVRVRHAAARPQAAAARSCSTSSTSTQHRHKLLAECSGGMQRRLTLAATLVHEPELLYLDEPTAGVDPILRERFWDHFRALRDEGRTIVVPTQYVGEAVSCDVVAVMAAGTTAHRAAARPTLARVRVRRRRCSTSSSTAAGCRGSELERLRALDVRRGPSIRDRDGARGRRRARRATCARVRGSLRSSRRRGQQRSSRTSPTFDEMFVQLIERLTPADERTREHEAPSRVPATRSRSARSSARRPSTSCASPACC